MYFNDTSPPPYNDRLEAGARLAMAMAHWQHRPDGLILALPRGGVPVALALSRGLDLPLDVLVVRKLGFPFHPELAMGALGPNGIRVLNKDLLARHPVSEAAMERVAQQEQRILEDRERRFRVGQPPLDLHGRAVVLVDDGLATGATMQAAIAVVRTHHPAHVAVAVPCGAPETCNRIEAEVDELICPHQPEDFGAVGACYVKFPQVSDAEVMAALAQAHEEHPLMAAAPTAPQSSHQGITGSPR
jgi:putative phosphoribosyl transferase